jgi:hypothetical protein
MWKRFMTTRCRALPFRRRRHPPTNIKGKPAMIRIALGAWLRMTPAQRDAMSDYFIDLTDLDGAPNSGWPEYADDGEDVAIGA